MYTQCPECRFAFRVTAKLLQQDGGQVRCSSCRAEFDAIDYLSEEPPLPADLEKQTSELLERLDELAGEHEVRIEDTGMEWQVHDTSQDNDAAEGESPASSFGDDTPEAQEMRFDDNTPLPDDFDELPEPSDSATRVDPQHTAEHPQEYLELGESDDWQDLLNEVGSDLHNPRSPHQGMPLEVEEELAAIHSELSSRQTGNGAATDAEPQMDFLPEACDEADRDSDTDGDSEDLTDAVSEPEDRGNDGQADTAADEPTDEETDSADAQVNADEQDSVADSEPDSEDNSRDDTADDKAADEDKEADDTVLSSADDSEASEPNVDEAEQEPDSDDKKAAIAAETTISGVPASLLTDASGSFESIVLEGDKVRGPGIDVEKIDLQFETQQDADTSKRVRAFGGRRKADPPGIAVIGAVVLLGALLAGQVVHANREQLSTNPVFNRAVVPVYRLLGRPLTPRWNIRGWQFQATKGSTDDDGSVLTILSRIANTSEKPLPYPLVHVSLTDRWEEIIGSRVLEPGDYLAGDLDPDRLVAAGERFTAIVTVDAPSPDATGFKLNICYRDSPGRVRCATEDFKN